MVLNEVKVVTAVRVAIVDAYCVESVRVLVLFDGLEDVFYRLVELLNRLFKIFLLLNQLLL